MTQDFCLVARRKNGRIASYSTVFATPQMDKKTSQVGLFFAGNHLGIFGKVGLPDARLEPGQRIETYRPMTANPQALREAFGDAA